MTTSENKPSNKSDQPAHSAGKPVDLMGMDIHVRSTGDGLDITLTELAIKDACMDQYGIGYEFKILKSNTSKEWKNAALSRSNFGLDNFYTSINIGGTSRSISCLDDDSDVLKKTTHFHTSASARAWFWAKDRPQAIEALKNSVLEIFSKIKINVDVIASLTSECKVEVQPAPTYKKVRPR